MNILLILISVLLNCAAQLCIRKGMLIVGEVGMSGMVQNLGHDIQPLVVGSHGLLCCEHFDVDGCIEQSRSKFCLSVPKYRLCGGSFGGLLFL